MLPSFFRHIFPLCDTIVKFQQGQQQIILGFYTPSVFNLHMWRTRLLHELDELRGVSRPLVVLDELLHVVGVLEDV